MERSSGQVQLTLVWNEECYRDATPKLQLLAKDLRSAQPELFHSIWVNFRCSERSICLLLWRLERAAEAVAVVEARWYLRFWVRFSHNLGGFVWVFLVALVWRKLSSLWSSVYVYPLLV